MDLNDYSLLNQYNKKPIDEIKDLVNFINCIGGKIKWVGKRTLSVIGVKKFKVVS